MSATPLGIGLNSGAAASAKPPADMRTGQARNDGFDEELDRAQGAASSPPATAGNAPTQRNQPADDETANAVEGDVDRPRERQAEDKTRLSNEASDRGERADDRSQQGDDAAGTSAGSRGQSDAPHHSGQHPSNRAGGPAAGRNGDGSKSGGNQAGPPTETTGTDHPAPADKSGRQAGDRQKPSANETRRSERHRNERPSVDGRSRAQRDASRGQNADTAENGKAASQKDARANRPADDNGARARNGSHNDRTGSTTTSNTAPPDRGATRTEASAAARGADGKAANQKATGPRSSSAAAAHASDPDAGTSGSERSQTAAIRGEPKNADSAPDRATRVPTAEPSRHANARRSPGPQIPADATTARGADTNGDRDIKPQASSRVRQVSQIDLKASFGSQTGGNASVSDTGRGAANALNQAVSSNTPTAAGTSMASGSPGAHTAANGLSSASAMRASTAGMGERPGSVHRQVAVRIAQGAKAGQGRVTVNLYPPHLGRVDVRMEINGNRMRVRLSTETREAQAQLQRDARELESALAEAGFDTSGGMTFEHSAGGDGTRKQRDNPHQKPFDETPANTPETVHIINDPSDTQGGENRALTRTSRYTVTA